MTYYVPDSWAETCRRYGLKVVTYTETAAMVERMTMIERLNKHFKETIWWQ